MTATQGRQSAALLGAYDPWRLLGLAVVAQIGFSVVEQGIPMLTGFVKEDLDVSAGLAGLAVSSYALGKMIGSYTAGVAADWFGERRVIVIGGVVTAVLVLVAVPLRPALLFALLGAAGVAGAASTPAGGRLIVSAFPGHRRGLALGMRQTGVPLGALVAAALLPWIAHEAGWRWALGVAAGVNLLAVVPIALARIPGREVGARATDRGPAIDRNVRLLTLWGCLLVTGQYAILAFLALDLHETGGRSLAEASLVIVAVQAGGIVGRTVWGLLSDRALAHGRQWLLFVLAGLGVASSLMLLAIPRSAPLGVLALVSALAGTALVGYQGHWITMIAEAAGPSRVGAATGFAVTFALVAIAVTPPLFGFVADATGSYRAIWAVLSGVLALAFVPAWLVREDRVPRARPELVAR